MASPRVLVLRAPGTNCDAETAYAFERAGGAPTVVHLGRWLQSPRLAEEFQILCLPGGFSYGDDVAAGRIYGNQLRHHLAESLAAFREAGKLILGICNGFQILIKSGLLDVDDAAGPTATLAWNESHRYQDRWVRLKNTSPKCLFLAGIDTAELPIAHAEGRFLVRDDATLARLEAAGQLALRYVAGDQTASGDCSARPYNPIVATADVAGVCDASGRVFGLMPHPERFIDRTQHPQWTRKPELSEGAGLRIFKNAVACFA